MRYAAPLPPIEDEWLQPPLDLPVSTLPRWVAPIVVDELDEAWNERAAAGPAGIDWTKVGLPPLRPAGHVTVGPGDPVFDFLNGTRDSLPDGWPDNAEQTEPAVFYATADGGDPLPKDADGTTWTEGPTAWAAPGEPTDEQLLAHAAQAAAELDTHGDDAAAAFGHDNADEMRTAIVAAEGQLATGFALGNGPLTDEARAALTLVARPPDWAEPMATAIGTIIEDPTVPVGTFYVVSGDQAAMATGVAVPGRIEPVQFEPVRFSAPVVVRDGEIVPPSLVRKRAAMIAVVQAYAQADPRSNQVEIGPSEIGDPCDSRVMRRALGFPAITWPDPWASFVGTAVHAKLADAFAAHNEVEGVERYLLERRVWMTDGMSGSTDLAEKLSMTEVTTTGRRRGLGVVDIYDHKVLGTDSMREQKKAKLAPTSKYGVQLDTYALGWRRAGYEVRTVNLALWPRSGFLDGLVVQEREPDYANAEAAIDRVSVLRQWALERGADEADEPWSDVPVAPGKGCGFCSYYNPHQPLTRFSCDRGRDFMAGAKAGPGPRGATP